MIVGGSFNAINCAVNLLKARLCDENNIISNTIEGTCNDNATVGEYSVTHTDNFNDNTYEKTWRKYTTGMGTENYANADGSVKYNNIRNAENISVNDGNLKLKATYNSATDTTTDGNITTHNIYTSKMDTKENLWFRYGYIEFSAKAIEGSGLGSTLWLHGGVNSLKMSKVKS